MKSFCGCWSYKSGFKAWEKFDLILDFEWILEDIINYFKLLGFKKGLKLYYSVIGKMYLA